jgi:hypothetical protein
MPVTTRASSERESDSLDQAEDHEAGEVGNQPAGAGAELSAAQGTGTAAGGAGEATSTPARLAARAIAAARGLVGPAAASTPPSAASTFSQEQLLTIAEIVKQAMGEHAVALSATRDESHSAGSAGGDRAEAPGLVGSGNPGDGAMQVMDNFPPADGAELDFVPDYGRANPHASAVFTGGDTYERPQRYNMHRDATFDRLKTKPNGTLFEAYTTLEPSLRCLFNVKSYVKELTDGAEAGRISPDEFVLHTDRVFNTVEGVYSLVNRYVGLIHLRAQFGDNPTAREKAKLEHLKDKLADEDFLPASLDERIREISSDFDDAYNSAKKNALAKKAANSGGGGGGGGGDGGGDGESKRAKAKRLEKERKAKEAAATSAK